MATATAKKNFLRIAPRKVRLVADMVRGKKVSLARDILAFNPREAAGALKKLLNAAAANAEAKAAEKRERINTDNMVITMIQVDGGPTTYRFRPAPRGRALPARKRTSHVTIIISDAK